MCKWHWCSTVTIDRPDFDAVSESDLVELLTAQVPEGLRVEYKADAYGNADKDKREFLKDISALANSHGGHLILGIEENEGVPTRIVGIGDVDADVELLRMEQVARSGLEPRIPGLRIRVIPLKEGGRAVVLRVPRSWNPPHRVVAQGANRFYIRHSAGVHEPNVEELRVMFTESASALERAKQFRADRLQAIRSGEGVRPLANEGCLILHIVPVASFSAAISLDMDDVHGQHMAFMPMGAEGMTPRFNYHGFVNERGGDQNHGYTQIFRFGALEATKARIIREHEGRRLIAGGALERHFFKVFSQYLCGLRDAGVLPPLIIMVTLEGVEGVNYLVRGNVWDDYEPPLPKDILLLPECVLEEYGTDADHHLSVKPAFDALWNAIGYSGSQFFRDDGLWSGGVQ